jgi:hypothetical protein
VAALAAPRAGFVMATTPPPRRRRAGFMMATTRPPARRHRASCCAPLLAATLHLAFATALPAQSASPMGELPRVERGDVVLDGRLDDAAWRSAIPLTLEHQLRPNEGASPTERTEVRLFYDGEALYIGARLHERDGSRIVSRAVERNAFHRYDQDGFAVILDTNGDQRTAFGFIVTPAGARTDIAVFDEARVSWNSDWNAFWDAATATDADGWTLEMRIPFSSLRFEPGADGSVRMGLILWRYLARNDEFAVYPAIPNRWGNSAYKPGLAVPVVFRGVTAANPLYLKPYFLGGVERRHAAAADGGALVAEQRPSWNLGGDLKYNVTSNLVLDVTVNTDFAQVEADDERFNLERFPLFFPEKRDFFQERADLFNYRLPGGSDRLFHSRRIGIAAGQPIPLHGGVRLTGQHAGWELGLLGMQTGRDEVGGAVVPAENFGVARVQRPVLDQGSYVGALFTSRTDLDGAHNLLYALDADVRVIGEHFVGLQAAGSSDRGAAAADGGMASIVVQRRINRGLSFGSSYGYVGRAFNPAVGFVRRTGTNRWGHRTQYTWFPGVESRVQNHSLAHRFEFVWDEQMRALETNTSSLNWDFRFRSGSSLRTHAEWTREQLETGFSVGSLAVPAGRYGFVAGSIGVGSPSGADLQASASLNGGGYFDGHRVGAAASLAWNPGAAFGLGVESVANRIVLRAGREDVLISRLRFGTAWGRSVTANAFIQHNSSAGIVTPNIRIRFNPREGSDLFLVYNEALNTDLLPGDPALPRLPRSQFRSVQVKYTYTFVR